MEPDEVPPQLDRGRLAFDLAFGVLPAVALLLFPFERRDFSALAGRMTFSLLIGGAMAAWTFLGRHLRRSAAYYVGPLLCGAIAAVMAGLFTFVMILQSGQTPWLTLLVLPLASLTMFAYGRAANDALREAQTHRAGCMVLILCLIGTLMIIVVPLMVGSLFRK